ncbi:MAG TPA: MBL fold metallo-hydrolase [Acidimicrobiales bacterium]|nr:MBL fold metallo-hydrolase [Acidimicrobiales bacterium]
MTVRVERVVVAGIFSLDGQDFEVENNVWVVGDDERVVVIDAPHDAEPILAAVGGRRVDGIVCTHGHNDHINAAAALSEATGAPIALHPDDEMLWDVVYRTRRPDMALSDGQILDVGGTHLRVLHTPGHSPGGVCLHLAEAGVVFSGDTLFSGGPGATGRSFSSFPTIIESIRMRLLVLPPPTVVHPGHGDSTAIAAEAPSLDDWIARGH